MPLLVVRDTGLERWDDADGYTAVSTPRAILERPPSLRRCLVGSTDRAGSTCLLKTVSNRQGGSGGTRCRGLYLRLPAVCRVSPTRDHWLETKVGSYRVREVSK